MVHKSSDGFKIDGKAMRIGISIADLPILALLGYFVGRSMEREMEGAIIGIVIGFVLTLVSIRSGLKSSNS